MRIHPVHRCHTLFFFTYLSFLPVLHSFLLKITQENSQVDFYLHFFFFLVGLFVCGVSITVKMQHASLYSLYSNNLLILYTYIVQYWCAHCGVILMSACSVRHACRFIEVVQVKWLMQACGDPHCNMLQGN